MTNAGMPAAEMNQPQPTPTEPSLSNMPSVNGPGLGEVEVTVTKSSDMASGEWSVWNSLKGTFISAPAAASWGENRLDVFVISTDSHLYHKWWNGSQWSDWKDLEGIGIYTPAAVSSGPNRLDVFVIGIDKQLYHKWWDGSQWNGFESLGGTCIHGVAATSWGPNRIDLFTVGTNSVIYHKWWDGSQWNGWTPLKLKDKLDWEKNSTSIAAPAAVAAKPGRIDLFALGIDNHVYHTWGDGNEWMGWQDVGGPCIQGIAAAARGADCIDLFTIGTDVEGTDNHLYHRWMQGSQWSDWENLGGACISAPAAAGSKDRLDTFVVGTRCALYQKSWTRNSGELGAQEATRKEKDDAIQAVDSMTYNHFTQAYKNRAKALIDNPSILNQGHWGICGMTAVVFFLLENNLDRFIELLKSIFNGDDFNGIQVGGLDAKKESALLRGRRKQLQKRLDRLQTSGDELDFIISRALAKLIKIKNPSVYKLQIIVSSWFGKLFASKKDDKEVNLWEIDCTNEMISDLKTGKLDQTLENKIELLELHVLLTAGYGIDLDSSRVQVEPQRSSWNLEYGWPVRGNQKSFQITDNGTSLVLTLPEQQEWEFPLNFTQQDVQTLLQQVKILNPIPESLKQALKVVKFNQKNLFQDIFQIDLNNIQSIELVSKTDEPTLYWKLNLNPSNTEKFYIFLENNNQKSLGLLLVGKQVYLQPQPNLQTLKDALDAGAGGNLSQLNDAEQKQNLKDALRSANFDFLYKVNSGINLNNVKISNEIKGSQWKLEYELAEKKVIKITQEQGNRLTFSIDLTARELGASEGSLKREGDFALDSSGILYLMQDVVGLQNVNCIFPFGSGNIDDINLLFNSSQKPCVIAGVNGIKEWLKASKHPNQSNFNNPPTPDQELWGVPRPSFMHFVAVTGEIKEQGTSYKIPVWTWTKKFEVLIAKEHISKYIYAFFIGNF